MSIAVALQVGCKSTHILKYMRISYLAKSEEHTHTLTYTQPPGASANRKWALVGGGGGDRCTRATTCTCVCVCLPVYNCEHKCVRVRLYVHTHVRVSVCVCVCTIVNTSVFGICIGRASLQEIKWLLVTHRLPPLHTATRRRAMQSLCKCIIAQWGNLNRRNRAGCW